MRRAQALVLGRVLVGLIGIGAWGVAARGVSAQPGGLTPVAYLPIVEQHLVPPTTTATPTPTRLPATATPTGVPPTATPVLPPPSFSNCQADPNPAAAPNYPVRITAIDTVVETVTLRNMTTGDTIDITGWTMCSITGNQRHPIGGTLAPDATQTFPGTGGPIWNNSSTDPGALYNPAGQLVSYYPD